MVFRKFKKRSVKKVFKRRSFRKKSRKGLIATTNMISYNGKSMNPFPPRFRTKFTTELTGSYAPGIAIGTYTWFVNGNSLHVPFNGGGWNGNLANTTTLQPVGFTNLCSATGPYNFYRVFASRCSIRFMVTTASTLDEIAVSLVPVQFTSNTPSTYQVASALPYAKSILIQPANDKNTMTTTMSAHKIAGVSARAIKDDLSGNYSSLYAAQATRGFNYYITVTTPGASVFGATDNQSYKCKVTYWAELWTQDTSALTQT